MVSKFMAIETASILDAGIRINLLIVAQLFTTEPRGDEFAVIDLRPVSLNDFRRDVVTIQTLRLDQMNRACLGLQEMANETVLCVYLEMLLAFEAAVTRGAEQPDAVQLRVNVSTVTELVLLINLRDRLGYEGLLRVAAVPQT